MRGEVEVFLDDTPGEIRGMIARDGRFERLIIHREDDPPQHRLGARCVGRVMSVEAGYGGAFIDLGVDLTGEAAPGFLKLSKSTPLREGDRIEVEVTAEPRERKGPGLRLIGAGQGASRLLATGPDVAAILAQLAPGVEVQTGLGAIQASWDAEEEALGSGDLFAEAGIDLAVQRTRALIAVDIDYAHLPGRDAKAGRQRANREGLVQAARLIRLKSWGGLVAIDLVGAGLNADAVTPMARAAFEQDEAVFGPLSRFGLLQLALPWRRTPIEDRLNDWNGRLSARTKAIDLVRRVRHAILSDTTIARFTAVCAPEEAQAAAPLIARLGPRAALRADPAAPPGRSDVMEG